MSDVAESKKLLKRYSIARIPFIAINTIERARTLDILKDVSEELALPFYVHTLSKGIYDLTTDKIINDEYTPEEEFYYAAIRRLPGDTTRKEINERVDKTIKMLGLDGVRKNRNVKLSGGEKTRVNIGIELVADRELLCLDEPDQGLSPNLKREIFEILRDLAHEEGKSVLCIVHDVSEINMFDQVIMMVKEDNVGRLAFSGTPDQARAYFGVDIRDAYALMEKNPGKYVR